MADPFDLQRELAFLDARQGALSPAEEQRRDLLRDALDLPVEGDRGEPGYVLDPESGYYWHPVARHWYEPSTGTYFDEEGRPLEVGAPLETVAGAVADPVEAAAALELEEVELELDEAADDGEAAPAPVAVHRFAPRRGRAARNDDQEVAMASEQDPRMNPFASPTPADEAPAAADRALEAAAELHLVGDDDVALVEEPELSPAAADAPPAGSQPPPLPRSPAVELLALPGPASDFELYAPAVVEEPAFEGAGPAWARALEGSPETDPTSAREEPSPAASTADRPESRSRPEPVRPPPPVLPTVPGRGAPSGLAPVSPPPPPPPAAREAPALEAASPSIADVLFGDTPASPTFVAGERQVVIHTREGQALRGSLRDVELEGSTLPLETRGGTVRIPADRVRAVFFIVPIGAPLPAPRGRRAKVVFEDGRPVSGLVADYRHDDPGFFLMPLETRGRTDRIYVYRDAIRSIAFA